MSLLDAVRRPEYTGENRCLPCTVVNLVVVAVVALLVGRRSRRLAALVFGAGAALISLRGYVVPGTPRFAPRLVAAVPGGEALFDHDAREVPAEAGSLAETSDPEALLETLVSTGVLEVEDEQVVPSADFEANWHEEMARLADQDLAALADTVFAEAHAASVTTYAGEEGEFVVLADGSDAFDGETWLTRPVAVAEVGAARALRGALPDADTRRAAAGALRMFLQACPDCGARLVETNEADCCGGYTGGLTQPAAVLMCPDCGVRLYTFDD
jgi:hypothetical protein